MKRIIKFRAQTLFNDEFVYGYYVKDPSGGHRVYYRPFDEATSNTYYFVKPETVAQFTGLLDKNGKEIYEGDILKFGYPINGADDEPDFLDLVVVIDFHGAAFWFTGGGYTDCNWHFYNAENREIIGNIYDNPEHLTSCNNN